MGRKIFQNEVWYHMEKKIKYDTEYMARELIELCSQAPVELLQELNADLCMSCGTCSFVCPAKRPLTPSIALAKIMMKNGGKK